MFMTRDWLANYSARISNNIILEARGNLQKCASARVQLFLSHSHSDIDLVEQARLFFASQGAEVYVDWKDRSMPEITSPQTAQKIKDKIVKCKKFVLLATDRALDSKWVPWELGFADGRIQPTNITVFPVTDNAGHWQGSEYVGVYSRVEKNNQGLWVVSSPNDQSLMLKNWLLQ